MSKYICIYVCEPRHHENKKLLAHLNTVTECFFCSRTSVPLRSHTGVIRIIFLNHIYYFLYNILYICCFKCVYVMQGGSNNSYFRFLGVKNTAFSKVLFFCLLMQKLLSITCKNVFYVTNSHYCLSLQNTLLVKFSVLQVTVRLHVFDFQGEWNTTKLYAHLCGRRGAWHRCGCPFQDGQWHTSTSRCRPLWENPSSQWRLRPPYRLRWSPFLLVASWVFPPLFDTDHKAVLCTSTLCCLWTDGRTDKEPPRILRTRLSPPLEPTAGPRPLHASLARRDREVELWKAKNTGEPVYSSFSSTIKQGQYFKKSLLPLRRPRDSPDVFMVKIGATMISRRQACNTSGLPLMCSLWLGHAMMWFNSLLHYRLVMCWDITAGK